MNEKTKYMLLGIALVMLLCTNGYMEQQDFELAQRIAAERQQVQVAKR